MNGAQVLPAVQFSVSFERGPATAQGLGKLLHQIDRSVLATGASNSYGYVAAVVPVQHFQPMGEKLLDVILHQRDIGLLL